MIYLDTILGESVRVSLDNNEKEAFVAVWREMLRVLINSWFRYKESLDTVYYNICRHIVAIKTLDILI